MDQMIHHFDLVHASECDMAADNNKVAVVAVLVVSEGSPPTYVLLPPGIAVAAVHIGPDTSCDFPFRVIAWSI